MKSFERNRQFVLASENGRILIDFGKQDWDLTMNWVLFIAYARV